MIRIVAAVAAAAGVWLLMTVITAFVPVLVPLEQLIDDVGQYVWFALPRAVISAAMVVAAALVYGRSRLRSAAGAVVVLSLPALDLVAGVVLGLTGEMEGLMNAAQATCACVGAAAAYWALLPAAKPASLLIR